MSRQGSEVARNRSNPLGNAMIRVAAAAALMGGLAACSLMPDSVRPGAVYGDTAPAQTPEGTTGFPALADVPGQKPASTSAADQKAIANSLAADRESAKHTDEVLRGGTEAPAPAPQLTPPAPLPVMKDVPADDPDADNTSNEPPKLLPMPGRGGHSTLEGAKRIQTAAVDMTKSAEAAAPEEPKANPDAEQPVSAAPTTPVEVKPTVDGGKSM